MDIQGSLRIYFWALLCLHLSGMLESKTVEKYTVLNRTEILDFLHCQVSDVDTMEWYEGANLLAKWKKGPKPYRDCISMACEMHQNGSLSLRKSNEMTTNYILKVYDNNGNLRCSESVTVIVEDALGPPVISHECTQQGVSIHCSTSARSLSELTLSWNGKLQSTREKTITIIKREQKGNVVCNITNSVSHNSAIQSVNCAGWSIYLIASVAGGGVALIIFIALVYYSVKYKPCKSYSRYGEKEDVDGLQVSTLQRQVQPCPDQTGHLRSGGGDQGDITEHGYNQKPPTPQRLESQETGGRKGKQKMSQRQLPQAQAEFTTKYYIVPNLQQTVPPLPGNHPSEQPPQPQPRSKPQRQNRKN
ncbi:hypothetical protein PRIEUP_LOCUS12015, partial [Pristimantis euphronides]